MPGQQTKYQKKWEAEFPWVKAFQNDEHRAFCKVCGINFSIGNQGKKTLEIHQNSAGHTRILKATTSSQKIDTIFTSKTLK